MQKTVIIIAGPTAVGKTSVAIDVARHFQTEIISADSRQCYKELNIGVARPSAEELSAVTHHFIATHSIHDKVTAADFESYALQKCSALFDKKDIVVMVGGTGLYIKAFCEGLDPIPEVPLLIRASVIEEYKQKGLAWLQQQVQIHDPLFYASAYIKNPHRLMRALEVYRATGRSVNNFKTGKKAKRDFNIISTGLELPKEELVSRIHQRVDNMMQMGLETEARSLLPYQHLNALQTVGYKELFSHFNGSCSLNEAVDLIKKNTRQYAKRQMTWFKKDPGYKWFPPDALPVIHWLQSSIH